MGDIRMEASHRLLDISSRSWISRCPKESGGRGQRRCWVVGQYLLHLMAAGPQYLSLSCDDAVLPAGLPITGVYLEDSHERECLSLLRACAKATVANG